LEPYGGLLIIVHPAGQLLRDGEPANPDIRCCRSAILRRIVCFSSGRDLARILNPLTEIYDYRSRQLELPFTCSSPKLQPRPVRLERVYIKDRPKVDPNYAARL
jgi:hypothetical protein